MKTIGLIVGALFIPFRGIIFGILVGALVGWRDAKDGYGHLWERWRGNPDEQARQVDAQPEPPGDDTKLPGFEGVSGARLKSWE